MHSELPGEVARPPQVKPIVAFHEVSKWYGNVIGLNKLTLRIPAGVTGLLGPNGAGKSTLLQLATGQLRPSQGRVTVLDSSSELFAAALKYLGYSANDVDPKHWDEAAALIKKAKPYWAAFNASSYIKELTVGNIWLVHGYSNDIFQANLDAQAAGRKFRILQGMPKEGAVLAVDNMVIHKSAPRPDLALKFINFMLEGKNSAELTNLIGSGNPNLDAIKYIKPELLKNPAIFPPTDVQAKLEQLKDLTTAQRRLRSKLWTEIKASK